MEKLTVIKTDFTYEQLKERFEKNVNATLAGRNSNEIEDVFAGNITREQCVLSYSLTSRRGGNNCLYGFIEEGEDGCTIYYKMQLPSNYYKAGYVMLFITVIANSVLMSLGLFLQFLIGILLLDVAFFILSFAVIDTRVEEEKCRKKINEIAGSHVE